MQPDAILNIIYIVINAIGIRQANIALVIVLFFFFSLVDKKFFCRKVIYMMKQSKAKGDGDGAEEEEGKEQGDFYFRQYA